MDAVLVNDLVVRYGERTAVDGIRFAVPAGGLFGLLGPNGGGKTSTFRVLSTLLAPTAGNVEILGLDTVRDAARLRPRIGVVFQAAGLDRKLTCRENLSYHASLYGLTKADARQRIGDMMERFGLSAKLDDAADTLSGGQRRRLEIVKALLSMPEVLLLDEPATGLDPGARRSLWELLQAWRAERGITVVASTHLLDEAEHCDRLALLHQGRIVAEGSPDALKTAIGGDVITVQGTDIDALARDVAARFSVETRVVDGALRLEVKEGHGFVAPLVEAFPGRILSVSMGRPTLEDVFVRHTGRHLHEGVGA